MQEKKERTTGRGKLLSESQGSWGLPGGQDWGGGFPWGLVRQGLAAPPVPPPPLQEQEVWGGGHWGQLQPQASGRRWGWDRTGH